MLTFADVLDALSGVRPEEQGLVVSRTVIDSRKAVLRALFIALPGERVDGHDYVQDAFNNGASISLVQRDMSDVYPQMDLRSEWHPDSLTVLGSEHFCLRVDNTLASLQQLARYWRHQVDVRVIGITGSVGKTTTKEVVAEVLNQRYRTLKNPGNLNNEIGLPLTLLGLGQNHERAVLEMGFYVPGEISFLCDLALPQVGVVTNIGTVHAERAGSQEVIAQGKAELVRSLPKDGVAILNYDDKWVREMANQTPASVFFYGLSPEADLWADGVEGLGLEGIRFRLHYRSEVLHLRVPLIGRHSVHTALRAAAVGLVEGLTWQEIFNGLRSEHTQLRLVAVRAENGALILDDTYNASPESTLAALNLLDELEGRKVGVLGDMLELGQYEWRGHEMVGVRAAEVVDELVTVGERGRMIAVAASRSGLPDTMITEFEESQAAIRYLQESLGPNDVVLVKGSHGIRMDKIVAALEAIR
ncbi:MAG: UDP-N-acetylmuramoyl-tripeptide--D-alanyl-D-alanine ligase [Anaerolineales bacterium]|nr:UDP-N-acetylmuramoyl-tripeptide--D-alanyl-D-alanine ligase [Anaerolineales bacterium]